ncbi:hypothetical protein AK812_SmicGene44675 [Symbiodinium microadriaticum]|uniref:Uncharacterized protein n=1 Tax=Symbiodinium microadriaticum TaxID=2951 RepID=A0A1Q9BXU8_SYMMI|nr:hypothetical protein AK812_SmicGene44675 [Symbiodinium microadriaticum]
MLSLFGGVYNPGLQERPQKFQKPNNSKDREKSKGQNKNKRQQEESEPSSAAHNLEDSLVPLVAQLCLRHDDAISILRTLRMDRAYVMLFKTAGEETMLKTIHDLGVRWKELQTARQTDCAKRIALIKGVVMELQTRAKALLEKPEKRNQLVQMGWLAQPALEVLLEHASGQIVQSFHPTRRLAEAYTGEIMEFKLEISLKGKETLQAHEALDTLWNWLLVGARKAFQAHAEGGCSRSFCSSFVASSDFAEPLFLSGRTRSRSFRIPCYRAACMEPPCSTVRQAKRVNRQRRLSTRSMAMLRNSARAFSRADSEEVVMTELVVMLAQKLQAATCQAPAFQEALGCIGLRTL